MSNTKNTVCEYEGDQELIKDLTHLFYGISQDERIKDVTISIVEGLDSDGLLKGEYKITDLYALLASDNTDNIDGDSESMLANSSYSRKEILEEVFVTINNIVEVEPMTHCRIVVLADKLMLKEGSYDLKTFMQNIAFATEDAFFQKYDHMIEEED